MSPNLPLKTYVSQTEEIGNDFDEVFDPDDNPYIKGDEDDESDCIFD